MDKQNENWLDDILGQRQDTEEITADEQAVASAGLTHPDELELERIVQETIAENWGSELKQEPVADDPDATQFFAPHITATGSLQENAVTDISVPEFLSEDLKESKTEQPVTEDVPIDEDALLRDIFAAVSHDSALLVGDSVVEESSATDAGVTEPTTPTVQPVPLAQKPAEVTPPVVEDVAPQKPEETPPLSADDIIREVLAEDPRNKNNMSEDAIIDSVLAEAQAESVATEPAAKAPERKSNLIISNKVKSKKATNGDEAVLKIRPAPKKGYGLFGIPHILSTGIWVVLILFIGITLGRTVWLCAEDLLALGKTGQEVTITVDEQDTLTDVAKKLENAGMIRYSSLFETFAKITGKGNSINRGPITFDATIVYDYNALLSALSYKDTPTNTIEVTIPEGYNCMQIFALLEEKGVCSAKDLEKYAAEGELPDYWFLEGLPRGNKYCLEGYLFPDTYEFYVGDEPGRVLEKFLDAFDVRFTDRLKEKYEKLNADKGLDMSIHEVIILASMVQKEKANDTEGYKISSVFYNRLTNSANYPFLDCDSTIVYAKDVLGAVTATQVSNNPYNTYNFPGLPPGPICNPGLSSLDAALEPEVTDVKYYFFVLDKENNKHEFSRSLAEHEEWKRKLGYYD